MSVLGAFYYVSTHNGSTDIVTNADGAPVARFVYEPFGKVNTALTDLDPDRNGVHYGETFMFTGQEYEPETGLYNYKARIYDPETGRFLQPDPKHTERAGFDNWDRYQYANNNPVNFIDPTGESWLSERFKGNWAKRIASGPLGRMWDRTLGKYGFGRWLHQRGVDRWLEGRHLDRWARASLKTAQRMTFVSKKRINDFGRGLGIATAGILGLAASAMALPAAVSTATVAVTAAISFSVAAVSYACMMTSPLACMGYVLGGLGTSSFNNIHWNERSARAGAFLGGAIHALLAAIYTGFVLYKFIPLWAAENIPTVWGYAQTGYTYFQYGLMVYDVASISMDSNVYTILRMAFSDDFALLKVPLIGWKALASALDQIYDGYERRL